jgi:alkanesulfonate monooxygenase SsuD/methylene tetrahydromethanopterin reductase-like flavin-dependent oxidoreductase (luciferase family)
VSLTFGLVLDFMAPSVTLEEQLQRYRSIVEAADRYGFHSVTMGEAYSTEPKWGHTPAPFLVLAALAPMTRMRIGSGVTLLPAWHPLKLAYDTAMLDQLSGGRLIVGLGLGGPELVHRYGYRQARRGGYIDEALAALKALWAGADGYQGTHLTIARGIAPLPVQPGGPPIWVGGSVQRSVDRAADYGDAYLGSTSQAFDQVVELGERYRAALKARGKDPRGAVVASNRLTLAAETEAEARALGATYCGGVLGFYANRGAQMPAEYVRSGKSPAELFAALDESRCLVGTPDQVAARARRYEQAGVTHIMARITPHGIPAEHAVRTVELLGQHVLPRFR